MFYSIFIDLYQPRTHTPPVCTKKQRASLPCEETLSALYYTYIIYRKKTLAYFTGVCSNVATRKS